MLVLTRLPGTAIIIDNEIKILLITADELTGEIKIGITAPKTFKIFPHKPPYLKSPIPKKIGKITKLDRYKHNKSTMRK